MGRVPRRKSTAAAGVTSAGAPTPATTSTGEPTSAVSATDAPLPVRKQAVVVIHGMGEPIPMDTMRSFVDAVWETDNSFRVVAGVGPANRNESWVVPDQRTGSLDLNRITTPPFVMRNDQDPQFAVRTDFFEFYWSDIMVGTTFEHLRAWMAGLLFRWPYRVPARVISAWIFLWLAVLLALFMAVMGSVELAAPGSWKTLVASLGGWTPGWMRQAWLCAVDDLTAEIVGRALTVLVAGGLFWLLVRRLYRGRKPAGAWARVSASWLFAFVVPAAIAALGWYVDWEFILLPPTVFLLLSAGLAFFIQRFLVPYFGDVARYVRAAPDTVAKRAEVRERGLKLLRELHRGSTSHDSKKKDDGYQRIVIVAHSLGSIIAYDILSHYWAEAGPTGPHYPPKGEVGTALRKMDDFLQKHLNVEDGDAPGAETGSTLSIKRSVFQKSFERPAFFAHQRNLSRALVEDGKSWRITDFVSLGSPLSHAAFLMAGDDLELEQKIAERQIATCPPYPDPLTKSIRFPRPDEDAEPFRYAHHASVFAAARWTNIYDPHFAIFFGDVISGRVGSDPMDATPVAMGRFGLGICDKGIRIHRKLAFPLTRLFTHTCYWSHDAKGGHIEALREAINLKEIFETAHPVDKP